MATVIEGLLDWDEWQRGETPEVWPNGMYMGEGVLQSALWSLKGHRVRITAEDLEAPPSET